MSWFFISKPVGNNEFSYKLRENRSLYVPDIIDISSFDEIKLQDEKDKIAFSDLSNDWTLAINYWLKSFYRIDWQWKKIILFDNHNHAYYYWMEARDKWIIWDSNTLYHIDQHADTRDNWKYLLKPDSLDLNKVKDYTNNVLNVWNYIVPALEEGIISEIIQIRSEYDLQEYIDTKHSISNNIILNLDLDFFAPELNYIPFELKKKVVLDIAKKAKVITIATSPFFVEQELAISVFKEIFWINDNYTIE